MKRLNFTINKLLSFLDNIGFMLLGTALSLAVGSPAKLALAAKFGMLGAGALFAGFLLGLINADLDKDCKKSGSKKAKKKAKKK